MFPRRPWPFASTQYLSAVKEGNTEFIVTFEFTQSAHTPAQHTCSWVARCCSEARRAPLRASAICCPYSAMPRRCSRSLSRPWASSEAVDSFWLASCSFCHSASLASWSISACLPASTWLSRTFSSCASIVASLPCS